jgi:hypothetical protein
MGEYAVSDRFGARLKETRPMRTVHKPENVEGVRATFREVHIILLEDMHYHRFFQVKAYARFFILTCLFIKQNANHEGTELSPTAEPSMLLSGLDTARTFVSRHVT